MYQMSYDALKIPIAIYSYTNKKQLIGYTDTTQRISVLFIRKTSSLVSLLTPSDHINAK